MNLPLKGDEVSAVGHAEELMLVHGALLALRRGDADAKLGYQGSAAFTKVADGDVGDHVGTPEFGWVRALAIEAFYSDFVAPGLDAQGAWEELMTAKADFSTLQFPIAEWSDVDIAALLYGLFQVGRENVEGTHVLLRRLRLR